MCFFFFVCKQKTAYEMRISDWSSDVCSSDLSELPRRSHLKASFGTASHAPLSAGAECLRLLLKLRSLLDQFVTLDAFCRSQAEALGPFDRRCPLAQACSHARPTLSRLSTISDKIVPQPRDGDKRSEEHTSELQSIMRISYA